jgi:hypothetical protein
MRWPRPLRGESARWPRPLEAKVAAIRGEICSRVASPTKVGFGGFEGWKPFVVASGEWTW